MLPCAPARLSTMTCWPHVSPSFAARIRASASVPPPGGNGTMKRTGLSGNCAGTCASARAGTAPRSIAMKRRFISSCYHRLLLGDPQRRLIAAAARGDHALIVEGVDLGGLFDVAVGGVMAPLPAE